MSRTKSLSEKAALRLPTDEFVDYLLSLSELSGLSNLSPVHPEVEAGRAVWVPVGDGVHQVLRRL